MKRLLPVILLAGLAACQLQPGTTPAPAAPSALPDTPTAAPILPTSTPPATATPTALPTPLPTLTPAAPPTPDPNQGVGDVVYADRLDGTSGWGWGYLEDGVVTFSTGGGQLDAVMAKPNVGPRYTLSPDSVKVGDQQLRVTLVANLCYENDEYGLAMRVADLDTYGNPNGYVFKLTCAGRARFEVVRGGQATVLADWTTSPAIVGGAPAENHLLIWAARDEFRFYINDKYLFSATDKTYAEGAYAFFLRDRTNGGESVSFSGLEVRSVTLP